MVSGSQTHLKEGHALTVNFLGGGKEAHVAAASYQKLAGFLCWPERSYGTSVYIRVKI